MNKIKKVSGMCFYFFMMLIALVLMFASLANFSARAPVTKLDVLSGLFVFSLSKWMLERRASKLHSKNEGRSRIE